MKPDRLQLNRPAASIIAQQYSSFRYFRSIDLLFLQGKILHVSKMLGLFRFLFIF